MTNRSKTVSFRAITKTEVLKQKRVRTSEFKNLLSTGKFLNPPIRSNIQLGLLTAFNLPMKMAPPNFKWGLMYPIGSRDNYFALTKASFLATNILDYSFQNGTPFSAYQ